MVGTLKAARAAVLAVLVALAGVCPAYGRPPTDTDPTSTFRSIMDNSYSCPKLLRVLYRAANPPELGSSHEDDNTQFIEFAKTPAAQKAIFLHLTLKVLKPLNDRVFAGDEQHGKDEVNTARNLYRILFSENVMANPRLAEAVVGIGTKNPSGRFIDFKSKEWAFDPAKFPGGKDRLLAEINATLVATGMQFDQAMRKTYGNDSELIKRMMKEHGLVGDFTAWHLAGVAQGSPDLAAFAARNSASEFDSRTGFSMNAREFSPEAANKAVARIEVELKPRLFGILGPESRAIAREGALFVLSRDAIDILRKVDAANFEEYYGKVSSAFKYRLGLDLTRERVKDLRDYLALADRFSPSIRAAKRESLDISGARHGKVSVDFAGQNVENLYQTMLAIARAHAETNLNNQDTIGSRSVKLARDGEVVATRRLDKLKANFLAAAKNAGVGEIKYSGDDGELVLEAPLKPDQWNRLFLELAKFPEPVSDYRVVHTPAMPEMGVIDTGAMSRETVKAEEFEKTMRNRMYGSLSPERMKQLAFATWLDPHKNVMTVTLYGNWSVEEAAAFRTAAGQPGATPTGYRISGINVTRP